MIEARDVLEPTFLEHLPTIEKIAGFIARRHGLLHHDTEDFVSLVKSRLIENDYLIFRKFRGESSMATYLAVVIASIYRDYRVQRWGRWRPSSLAKRYGSAAVRLETLVYRDGSGMRDAIECVSREFSISTTELRVLFQKLPRRDPLRPSELDVESLRGSTDINALEDAPNPLLNEERARVERALNGAVSELEATDRALVKMKFWENLSIADISRIAGLPQKQLYRRFDKIISHMRRRLLGAGITASDVDELLTN